MIEGDLQSKSYMLEATGDIRRTRSVLQSDAQHYEGAVHYERRKDSRRDDILGK
jgi:hypothetical protein